MRLDPKLKAELQKLADADRRTLTNFVETKLWEMVETQKRAQDEFNAAANSYVARATYCESLAGSTP